MRFTVTALGSAGDRPVGVVVGTIARYLLIPEQRPEAPGEPSPAWPADGGSVSRYYADRGDTPGRWLGQGARELDLQGTVDFDEFTTVLAGRDPRTGQRLLTAQGSAGRVASLGTGTVARWSPQGEALYSMRDAAKVLGWSQADVREAIADGERLAASRLIETVTGTPITTGTGTPGAGPGGDPSRDRDTGTGLPGPGRGPAADRDDPDIALVPFIDRDDTRYITDGELSRIEDLARRGVSADEVLEAGDPADELSIPAAARLVGASPSYLARLCRNYLKHRDEITTTLAPGETPKRAHLACRQDQDGSYRVTRAELAAYAERRRRPAVRVGYDATATTEKSISVLALLGGPEVRREALAAVEAANDAGLRWLEYRAAAARAGGQVIGVTGWTAASFQHLTSRRLDPFVHHHNVVANTVVDEHGQRRALDARHLYRSVTAASAIATAQVRWELTARLGVACRPARHGGWEIADIADPVLDEFSQRRREIKDAIRELEDALGRASTLNELNSVVATTRPAKTKADEADLLAEWWHRARAHGLTPTGLHQTLGRARPTMLTAELRARILAAAATAVTGERSIFTRADVLATLVDLPHPDGTGLLIVPATTLETLADELLGSTRVVQLERTTGRADRLERADGSSLAVGGDHEPEYTTTDMLALQTRILDRYQHGTAAGAGTVDPTVVDATLARFPELSTEQRRLVWACCTSGDRAQSGIGRPGTGKTHTMRAAVAAWQAAGYRVLGAAVKAEAARHLGHECGIFAEPLAWYLNRLGDPHHSALDHRTVLIVDEASTVADRALDRLVTGAAAAGATVRFIGDPAQHGSVRAGGMWHYLIALHASRTPELTADRRVQHHADHAAAEALRHGQVADALATLEAAGHLHIIDSERDLYIALLTRWWTARHNGEPHPMVDRRNDQRLVLNRLARALCRQAGELGDVEITAAGDRRFAVGDDVIARMGDRTLHPRGLPGNYVRNGTHGTVTAVHPAIDPADDCITVDFDGLGLIDLPQPFFDEHRDIWGRVDVGLDHAYAITSYAVEGLTYDESTSHVDPRSSRPEVYVDITRGRRANHVYLTQADDHLADERLPAAPTEATQTQLEHHLTHSGPEHAAIVIDTRAARAAAYAAGRTLAELTQERLTTNDPDHEALVARAERLRERQVGRASTARPDSEFPRRFVPRPSETFLAARYDELLGELAVYRARWQPSPGRRGPWDWALGQTVHHPEAQRDRRRLAQGLEQLAVAVVARQFGPRHQGLADARLHVVRQMAAEGTLGVNRSGHLDNWCAEVGDSERGRAADEHGVRHAAGNEISVA